MPGSFDKLFAAFDHIRASGRKWPEVKAELGPNKLPVLFSFDRMGNGIYVSEQGAFKARKTYGLLRRGEVGKGRWYQPAHGLSPTDKGALWEALRGLSEDPVAKLAEMGQGLGYCVCCGLPLSNDESIARGIGPECWKRLNHG